MDVEKRIEQFEQLCKDDPGNDMAHFSLGGALAQAGRHEEAARAYVKAVELNEGLSKAYQLAGQAYRNAHRDEDARDILRRGYVVAASRGDTMPKEAMAKLLHEMGMELPELPEAEQKAPAPDGSFIDRKTGRPGTKMARPPFKGGVGTWIQENISKETFDEWIGMGTKIINELKLDLSNDEHDAVYDYAMRVFLGLNDDIYREATGGQEPLQPPGEYREVIDQIMEKSGDLEQYQGGLDKRVGG